MALLVSGASLISLAKCYSGGRQNFPNAARFFIIGYMQIECRDDGRLEISPESGAERFFLEHLQNGNVTVRLLHLYDEITGQWSGRYYLERLPESSDKQNK